MSTLRTIILINKVADLFESCMRGLIVMQAQLAVIVNRVWEDHSLAMQMIHDVLLYLDRKYLNALVPPESIAELGHTSFRDLVIDTDGVLDELLVSILARLDRDRHGDRIDRYRDSRTVIPCHIC